MIFSEKIKKPGKTAEITVYVENRILGKPKVGSTSVSFKNERCAHLYEISYEAKDVLITVSDDDPMAAHHELVRLKDGLKNASNRLKDEFDFDLKAYEKRCVNLYSGWCG